MDITEKDIETLIKWRAYLENGSMTTKVGIGMAGMSILAFIVGAAMGMTQEFKNIGGLLFSIAPWGLFIGGIVITIGLPIWLIAAPKYKAAKERTDINSHNTPELINNAIFKYLRNQEHHGKASRADAAIKLIAEKSGDHAIDVVINILKDSTHDDLTRSEAASYLGLSHDERAVQPLIKALEAEQPTSVRESAARSLGYTGDARVVEPLTEALKDENKKIRKAAKEALKWLKS